MNCLVIVSKFHFVFFKLMHGLFLLVSSIHQLMLVSFILRHEPSLFFFSYLDHASFSFSSLVALSKFFSLLMALPSNLLALESITTILALVKAWLCFYVSSLAWRFLTPLV